MPAPIPHACNVPSATQPGMHAHIVAAGAVRLQLVDELVDLSAHFAARGQATVGAIQRIQQRGADVLRHGAADDGLGHRRWSSFHSSLHINLWHNVSWLGLCREAGVRIRWAG